MRLLVLFRIIRLLGAALAVACTLAACADGDEQEPFVPYGGECVQDAQCGDDARCATARVCTAPCEAHDQCGCPAGTTNGDILDGKCGFACFEHMCTRPCETHLDCAGTTDCRGGEILMACL